MGKRLAPIFAVLAMLLPVAANALGLGDIVMKSALNQPLDAEIELLAPQGDNLDKLAVQLGSAEDFARVGTERSYFLTKIKFSVAKKPDGTPFISLSSSELVTEPYLDFVVEARWPRGRILREFTVLVDPPVLSEEAPAPVQQAAVQATPTPAPAPATTRQAPIRERATLAPVMQRDGVLSYGPVKPNDTLWVIANKLRPDASVSANQMMLALVRDNPQAFYNGNVNQLKAGYVLRIENPTTITALSAAEATAEVERQRVEWEARKSGRLVKQAAVPGGQAVAAEGGATGAAAGAAAQARLKLVAPGSEGAGSGAGDESVERLRQDLVLAAEALDANRQETEDLKTRLGEMETQLQAMQRLITLKDDEMLRLQQQLSAGGAEQGPETAAVAEPAATEEDMLATEETLAGAEAMPEAPAGEAAEPMAEPAGAPAEEEPQQAAPVPAPASMPEALLADLLNNPLLMYGGIGLVVLLISAWLVMRRRKMQDGFQESILNVGADGATAAGAAIAPGGESSMVSDFAMSEMSDMSGIQTDSTEVDPVSEADVYLAYGRHQQAEDILREAMEKAPERHELKLKMLEVYFAAKNSEGFEEQAEELHDALGDESDPLWSKAVTMGQQLCPGNPLFGGTSAKLLKEELDRDISESDEDLLDFDFDIDSAALDDGGKSDTPDNNEDMADLDFGTALDAETMDADAGLDFDTQLDAATGEVGVSGEAVLAPAAETENTLDFDVSTLDFNLDQDAAVGNAETKTDAEGPLDFDVEGLDETLGETETLSAEETEAVAGLNFSEGESVVEMAQEDSSLAAAEGAESEAASEVIDLSLETEPTVAENALEFELGLEGDELASDTAIEFDAESELDVVTEEASGLAEVETEAELNLATSELDELAADSETVLAEEEMDSADLVLSEDEDAGAGEEALGEAFDEDLLGEDIFAEVDEVGTKLDLAKAYVDMGDSDGARSILDEVLDEGDDTQKEQAKELLAQIG